MANTTSSNASERISVEVEGVRLSALQSGSEGPPVLLLHGTYWSRVWAPVLPALGQVGRCYALDFPGFGFSDGELTVDRAAIPALAHTALAAADALGLDKFAVVGHDIGGGVAQHLAVHASGRVSRLALVNAVIFDSWPVPAVSRFRDAAVRASTSTGDVVASRLASLRRATARPLGAAVEQEYLIPWHEDRRARSWLSMAAAADSHYTEELVPGLIDRALPTTLVWGRDDEFQLLRYAEQYVEEVPAAALVTVPGKHIPQEDSPGAVADALTAFLA